ncbi:hypothetical protein AbraIFM66950_008305 [Aspergillus brasiliensis]|nr:hypothetical protein AbraIFM66950_008305 [Aspergillus brasiliensis]
MEVREWSPPDAPGGTPVTPSVLSLTNSQVAEWGHPATGERNRVSYMKLCIEGAPVVPVGSLDLKTLLGEEGFKRQQRRRAERMICKYLRHLREAFCADDNVRQVQDNNNLRQIDWHFSMPACWTAEGIRTMRSAVEDAGYLENNNAVYYCTEGIAAAIGVSYRLRADVARVGDQVLICDIGGATTDITTFAITAMHPSHNWQMSFRQVAHDSTADCANPFVEQQLLQHLRQSLGLALGSGEVARLALEAARTAKERFNGTDDPEVPLPLDEEYLRRHYNGECNDFDRRGQLFRYPAQVLRNSLDHVANHVMGQIIRHIRAHGANRVVMVGGLSCSPYLRSRIASLFEINPDVSQLLPVRYLPGLDAVTIISHGLTIKGSTIIHPMQYQSEWGYEIFYPFSQRLGTDLFDHRRRHVTAIRVLQGQDRVDVPAQGNVLFRLSIQRGRPVNPITIKPRKGPDYDEPVGSAFLAISFDCGLLAGESHDGTIRYFDIQASWELLAGVHLELKWAFQVVAPAGRYPQDVRITHSVDHMTPRWA